MMYIYVHMYVHICVATSFAQYIMFMTCNINCELKDKEMRTTCSDFDVISIIYYSFYLCMLLIQNSFQSIKHEYKL